jgi:hypothetical protein
MWSWKKLFWGIGIVLIGIQFIRIDKENPISDASNDISQIVDIPDEVVTILRTSCYDCHSNETVYPWYSNVAPVSWWLKQHVNEAREELNFSQWGEYSVKRKNHKFEEIAEEVEEAEMPLPSYLVLHSESSLSQKQLLLLTSWAKKHL